MSSIVGTPLNVALPNGNDSGNVAVTVPAGVNAYVVSGIGYDGANLPIATFSLGGVNGTLLSTGSADYMVGYLAYGLATPGATNVRLTTTNTGFFSEGPTCQITWLNVDNTSDFVRDAKCLAGALGPFSTSVNSISGEIVILYSGSDGGGNLSGAITNFTQIGTEQTTLGDKCRVYSRTASASTTSATGHNNGYAMLSMISIKNAADSTAPVLSSPTGTATSATTATGTATTDEANGTAYAVVTTSTTQPSVSQIKAGQNHTGAAAAWAGNQTVSSTGVKTFNATGLTAATTYYFHFVHTDASSNDSNRVSSSSFTTGSAPIFTAHPSNATVSAGATANFTTTSTGGTSYQWQVNRNSDPVVTGVVKVDVGTAQNPSAQSITIPATSTAFAMFAVFGSTGGFSSLSSLSANFVSGGTISFTSAPGTAFAAAAAAATGVVSNLSAGRTFTPAFNRANELGAAFIFVFFNNVNTNDLAFTPVIGQVPDNTGTPATAVFQSATDSYALGFDVRAGTAPTTQSGWTSVDTHSFNVIAAVGIRVRRANSPGSPTTTITSQDTASSIVAGISIKRAGFVSVSAGSGGTTQSYTTETTTVGMSGWQYRNTATNTDGTTNSNAATLTVNAGDVTAPTLTSPTGTATGGTTASGTVSTNEANGTLYRLASTNATESAATVIAANLTQTVSATGVQNVTFTGLTSQTVYYAHYVHVDAASNQSTRVSSSSFTTFDVTAPTLTSPTGTATGGTTASGTVSTNEANGTLYRLASTNATELASTVIAANLTQAVSSTGVQNVTFTGLTSQTVYHAHYVHVDSSSNQSSRVSSSSFTTFDVTAPTLTSPTGTQTGPTTASGSVSTNEANGTLYRLASTNSTELASTVIAAALSQAVSSTGVQNVTFTGLTPSTVYYAHYVHVDSSSNQSARVSSVSFTTPTDDVTAPTLTSPTGTATGGTTASGTVSTNEANGTLYRLASTNPTPSAATVIAANLTQTVSATGVQNVTFTGLTSETTYYAHYVHVDAVGNQSSRVSSAAFTTNDITAPTLTSPTGTQTGQTTASGSVSTNEASGTLYRLASTAPTPSAATVIAAALTQAVSTTGVQNVTFTGLTANTTYYAHFVHVDGAGNQSSRVSSASFTTLPVAPSVSVTTQTQKGQQVVVAGTYTSTATSGTVSIAVGDPANGAVAIDPTSATVGGGTFSITFTAVTPGNYSAPAVSLTGPGGVGNASGSAFTILGVSGTPQV